MLITIFPLFIELGSKQVIELTVELYLNIIALGSCILNESTLVVVLFTLSP